MARPRRKGLDYFPVDVDLFWDEKIFELSEQYGTKGQTVYMALLCEIYREGYYMEISVERLAQKIMRNVGDKWFEDRSEVVAVIDFCARIGLLDRELYSQGVMTSTGIQRRYAEVTSRRKVSRGEYWLLPEKPDEAAGNVCEQDINAAETDASDVSGGVTDAETGVSVYDNATKKTKENQTKQNESIVNQIKSNPPAGEPDDGCAAEDGDEMTIQRILDEFGRIKTPTKSERRRIEQLCVQFGLCQVLLAVEETQRRKGKSLNYTEKVLATMTAGRDSPDAGQSWQEDGFIRSDTPVDYDALDDDGW